MPRRLQKSLQTYLSKLKKPKTPRLHFSPNYPFPPAGKILSGCRHPKTPSFAIDRKAASSSSDANHNAATLSDIDRFLSENFKSLYPNEKNGNGSPTRAGLTRRNKPGSNRFFVSTDVSGSLVDEASRLSMTASTSSSYGNGSMSGSGSGSRTGADRKTAEEAPTLPENCIAVMTYSPDPYEDFRQSMEEMIGTRFEGGAKVDWEFMEELLFCYLNLNEKKSYRFILSAFVDLVVALRQKSSRVPAKTCRRIRAAEERRNNRGDFGR